MKDIEKLIEAVRLCGSTPKVDQCKQCTYWAGGDMSKCIPRMTLDASTALSMLRAENEGLRAELKQVKAERDAESSIEHYKHMAFNMAFICQLMKQEGAERNSGAGRQWWQCYE